MTRAETNQKPCTTCGRRPRMRGQRQCRECHAEYMREWRAGKSSMMVTDAERTLILEYRERQQQNGDGLEQAS
jgi:hypothetical protein